jgi:hypothetical protein
MGLMMGLMFLFFHNRGHHRPQPKPAPDQFTSQEDRPSPGREPRTAPSPEAGRAQVDSIPESTPAPEPAPSNSKGE